MSGSSAADGGTKSTDAGKDGASPEDGGNPKGDASAACSVTASARAARSTGFSGTIDAYFALYDVACTTTPQCIPSCVDAGGTTDSCTLGEQCIDDPCPDGGASGCLHCLPPTYWLDVAGALGQPGSGNSAQAANDLQAFDNGYNDTLDVTDFGVTLPAGATVRGIEFHVDREANDLNANDNSVRILKAGAPVGADHASTSTVPEVYTEMIYGGAADLWGTTWTAADVAAAGFGIALTPQYNMTAGNDTVYVDSVSVTVFYGGTTGCP